MEVRQEQGTQKKGFTPTPKSRAKKSLKSWFLFSENKEGGAEHSSMVWGFTIIEIVVAIGIFSIFIVGIYQVYPKILEVIKASELKVTATALANEQFEIVRNLPYTDVGISGGIPTGKLTHTQALTRDGIIFSVITTVRNVDDPFDGKIGGTPNDLSPADYKFVDIEVTCSSCKNFTPMNFTSTVAPKALETTSNNGALFIKVFDASGQPVAGANIHVENNVASPKIVIDDTTDINGLQIVDAPPGVQAYEITVSKSGYSQEKTYLAGDPANPHPLKAHATVVAQQVTQISFSIDQTSTLDTSSVTQTCTPIGNIDFSLQGTKLIGTSPDIPKYSASHVTNAGSKKTISGLEWDTYNATLTNTSYDLIGSIPLVPTALNPATNQDLKLIVALKDPKSLLVTVRDASSQLPLSGTTVTLQKTGYTSTLTTGRGFLRQTDWSGGEGQTDFTDPSRYLSSDGNVDVANPIGEIKLHKIFSDYQSSGILTSSTFDTGSASNFDQVSWLPQNQPPETGANSVTMQVATNNDNTTWSFRGPDGTGNSFYTSANLNLNPIHNGDRYMRYKVFLNTASTTWTPNVGDVSLTFTSTCVPPGQVIFTGLGSGDYTLTVSKSGYQVFTDTVNISPAWQQKEVILSP